MATVENKALANQTVHSRWGYLEFNAQGQCDVTDEIGLQIQDAAPKGFQVFGLPTATTPDDLDNEVLEEEDVEAATVGASPEHLSEKGDEEEEEKPKKASTPKLGKKKHK